LPFGGQVSIYEMPAETATEIDEPDDWERMENTLQQRYQRTSENRINHIRGLVIDVDGTLTDGGMYYGAQGEALKKI